MSGYSCDLFNALDCADLVTIDGCELGTRYEEQSPTRRYISLANEEDMVIEDQRIVIIGGRATFKDAAGQERKLHFTVHRPLLQEDLLENAT